jgi:hypothetical protein
MASGNTYQCINILKVSTSQLTNSSNHAPWPEQRHGNEKQGRLVLVAVVVAVLVLVVEVILELERMHQKEEVVDMDL